MTIYRYYVRDVVEEAITDFFWRFFREATDDSPKTQDRRAAEGE